MTDRTRPLRAMWLLNHTTARKFEVPMLKSVGVKEIFLPKHVPDNGAFRSGSVDWSEDAHLTIPKDDLDILNSTHWHGHPRPDAWKIANKHFDIAIVMATEPSFKPAITKFKNALIYRAYGFDKSMTYSGYLQAITGGEARPLISQMGRRFSFGEAYDNIHKAEPSYLSRHRLFLPAGMNIHDTSDDWTGNDRRIMFVCPDLIGNPYYWKIYTAFRHQFSEFDYVIAGQQYVESKDPRILGFVSLEAHRANMRNFRVMFYHSEEPRHLHYHPLEAIAAGMPLVYMAGGMLDRFGGTSQPGRCLTIEEARQKIRRVLDDDTAIINSIRERQMTMLKEFTVEHCKPIWKRSIAQALDGLAFERRRAERNERIQQFASRHFSWLKPGRRDAVAEPTVGPPMQMPSSALGYMTSDIDWLS